MIGKVSFLKNNVSFIWSIHNFYVILYANLYYA